MEQYTLGKVNKLHAFVKSKILVPLLLLVLVDMEPVDGSYVINLDLHNASDKKD